MDENGKPNRCIAKLEDLVTGKEKGLFESIELKNSERLAVHRHPFYKFLPGDYKGLWYCNGTFCLSGIGAIEINTSGLNVSKLNFNILLHHSD